MKNAIKLVIFCIFIAGFIYFGTLGKENRGSNKRKSGSFADDFFGSAYVFESINHSKLLSKLSSKNQNMIIYACYIDSKLCAEYGEIINDIALNYEIEKIYYYDFKTDKSENNATYQKIVSKFSDFVFVDDLGKANLYAPTLIFIKDGEVYEYDDDLAFVHGNKDAKDILTDEKVQEKREYLINVLEGYLTYE